MVLVDSQCMFCKHRSKPQPGVLGIRCAAFPDGIPDDVLTNTVSHERPIKGDNGVQFATNRKIAWARAKRRWRK